MKQFFCLGSYTEPILFGTGEVFQGKGKGVSICRFEDGLIETVSTLSVRNPSFVCIDEERRKLYAVNEMKEYGGAFGGGVTQIGYSPDGGMRVEADFNTGGTDPCHIEIAPNGRFLSIANFASGAVSVFARDEAGNLLAEKTVFQHQGHSVHPVQAGPSFLCRTWGRTRSQPIAMTPRRCGRSRWRTCLSPRAAGRVTGNSPRTAGIFTLSMRSAPR